MRREIKRRGKKLENTPIVPIYINQFQLDKSKSPQTLDQSLLTVSLGGWMELPSLTMEEWRRLTATKEPAPELKTRRTSAGTLARYYPDYVRLMGLEENFVENTVVTSVRQLHGEAEDVKMEVIPDGQLRGAEKVKNTTILNLILLLKCCY